MTSLLLQSIGWFMIIAVGGGSVAVGIMMLVEELDPSNDDDPPSLPRPRRLPVPPTPLAPTPPIELEPPARRAS
jgi:hypothetical protein